MNGAMGLACGISIPTLKGMGGYKSLGLTRNNRGAFLESFSSDRVGMDP